MNEYIWRVLKHISFSFSGHAFGKENIEDRVKLLEVNVLNCCLKMIRADLRRVGLKMTEWHFRELSS